ncbi:MAG: asparagine synthase (glutamine-hydrolyzing) [bacterium]|nr:asparagine synthase (glutamine-hydrolyzing) [bacterium]
MCGIAGVIKVHDPADGPPPPPLEAIPEQWLDILDESIKHRGPDGQGRFRDRAVREDGTVVDVALVHRRLSIIDHEGGHQPMVHDGERLRADLTYQPGETPIIASEVEPDKPLVAVVFNGCIYNHRELRKELEGQGCVFETDHSDTEVLVHGWRAWGLRQLDELDGMYAALIWEGSTGQLAWGRDLTGEKPLYQSCELDHTRCFASTPTGLVTLGQFGDSNSQSVYTWNFEYWIAFGAESVPAVDLYEMQQSEWSICPSEPLRGAAKRTTRLKKNLLSSVDRKYQLPKRNSTPGRRFVTAKSSIELFERCVAGELEADVPIGVFLSGGIDSALIASITHSHRPDVKAFTVRMPDVGFDESRAAGETAKHIGIQHYILDCNPDPADDLVLLIKQLGLPFGDSSLLPTYWVSKAAREHVKVALSGDGGDELFGGYRRHTINPILNRWHRLLKYIPTSLLNQRLPNTRTTYLARLATAARFGGYHELLAIFPTKDLRQLIPIIDGEPTGYDRFYRVEDPLRHDFKHYLPDDLLRKTDTASMAVGLEVRAPFLAKELVDAALRTPLDILMPNGERKGLLKQVARKYLPDHIVDRPKQGFAIPIGEWFRSDYGGMRQLLYDHLHSSNPFPGLAEAGVELNMKFVEQMLREHDAAGEKSINPWRGRDHSQRLYMLLVLSIWAKWLQRVRKGEEKAHA